MSETERFLDQVAVFSQVHPGLFQRFFEPEIAAGMQRGDEALIRAIQRRADEERARMGTLPPASGQPPAESRSAR